MDFPEHVRNNSMRVKLLAVALIGVFSFYFESDWKNNRVWACEWGGDTDRG
jgi:hypothetical protein